MILVGVLAAGVTIHALNWAEQYLGHDLVGTTCLILFVGMIIHFLWKEYGKKTPGV